MISGVLFILFFSVDSCVPGDVVTISGIVKVSNIEEGKSSHMSYVEGSEP